jgi:hypothetical protein
MSRCHEEQQKENEMEDAGGRAGGVKGGSVLRLFSSALALRLSAHPFRSH